MNLAEFINLFDKTALESKKISFAVHISSHDREDTWIIYCDNKSKEELIESIERNDLLNDLKFNGLGNVHFELTAGGVRVVIFIK